MAAPKLSPEQVEERKAILRRFRKMLEQQRHKFREYLGVLEKQASVIENGNVEAMVQHTEIEQGILSEIHTIQKVITPLEDMYRETHPGTTDAEIPRIHADLSQLREQVLQQNEKNRELLKGKMQLLRNQVVSLRSPSANRSSIYASDSHSASVIDIKQ